VRLQRDFAISQGISVITRKLPVELQGGTVELLGFMRTRNVSDLAELWIREDAHGQMLSLENMQSQRAKGSRDCTEYRVACRST